MVPQTKVFVGSLPQGSKPEDLRKAFERFGDVTECDIMNRCGFVHMQTEDQASAAIRGLHNTTFNGAVISVERGRIKERGQRGGGGGGRGMRGAGRGGERRGGGPMRGGHPGRDAPYMREARPMGHLRQIPGAGGGMHSQGMPMRNGGMGGGYDRGMERTMGGGGYDDRYGGYGAEDRRGFALMDARDPYAAPAPMYGDDRRGGYGAADDMGGMYQEERRAPMYDEMDMMDRRTMGRGPPMTGGYDRGAAQRPAAMGNGDMFSRRSPMRGGSAAVGGYERDPYAQQYPPMGRGGGAATRSGGMGPRRY